MGLSESGEFYTLYQVGGGFELLPMDSFAGDFPFKILGEKVDELEEDLSGFDSLEEPDPFRESNVINLDTYFFRNQGRRGR